MSCGRVHRFAAPDYNISWVANVAYATGPALTVAPRCGKSIFIFIFQGDFLEYKSGEQNLCFYWPAYFYRYQVDLRACIVFQ